MTDVQRAGGIRGVIACRECGKEARDFHHHGSYLGRDGVFVWVPSVHSCGVIGLHCRKCCTA